MAKLRGVLPDAVTGNREIYLFKACKTLRLTHEIKLLTYMANETGKRLIIKITGGSTTTPDLQQFAQKYCVQIVRTEQ